jgi:hypothetical protein
MSITGNLGVTYWSRREVESFMRVGEETKPNGLSDQKVAILLPWLMGAMLVIGLDENHQSYETQSL